MREYSFDPHKAASQNLANSARLSYVRGNPDDYGDWNEWDREELRKPLAQSYDVEEFSRRFNRIIESHATRWADAPIERRDRYFYAHKYASLFEDIYRLLEKFPRVGTNAEYWKILKAASRYMRIEDATMDYPDPSQWRNI